jgi:ER-derived vesicles protein
MVVARRQSEIGVGALFGVVVSQALGYGLIFDLNFFFRYPSKLPSLIIEI